jgi:hypothetical protein
MQKDIVDRSLSELFVAVAIPAACLVIWSPELSRYTEVLNSNSTKESDDPFGRNAPWGELINHTNRGPGRVVVIKTHHGLQGRSRRPFFRRCRDY